MAGGFIGRSWTTLFLAAGRPGAVPVPGRAALRVVAALRPAGRGDVVLHHRRQHLHPHSHTVRAADDALRVFLAHEPNSPDAAASVRHLAARLGEQYGPQFVQDVAAKLLVELAEATAAIATEDNHEGIHAQAFLTGLVPD